MSDRARTEMEQLLSRVWGQALKMEGEEIELDDTFVDLGGDSMDALQVISVVEKELGVKLHNQKFFISTLEQVAKEVEEMVQSQA